VVTSETGAVIHDIRNVIAHRFPAEIVLSPTAVQGPGAEQDIAAAIRLVGPLVDVIIVGRGGGSSEDLFAFNHPAVVEAIATSPVPVIAAIGHEVDVTLADLAADHRASTPSHAAEICVKDRKAESESLHHYSTRISRRLLSQLEQSGEDLNDIRERLSLGRLERLVSERRQYLVDLTDRMDERSRFAIGNSRLTLREYRARLQAKNPVLILLREIPERKNRLSELEEWLRMATVSRLASRRAELTSIASLLEARNPSVPCRDGYCLVRRDGALISSAALLTPGDIVEIRLRDGTARAEIHEVNLNEKV
jgi:exodeoxyribonuclease VII large subunit